MSGQNATQPCAVRLLVATLALSLAGCTAGATPSPAPAAAGVSPSPGLAAASPTIQPGPSGAAAPSGLVLPAHGLIAIDVAHDPNGETSTIAVLEPDGTGYREVTAPEDGRAADPSWSRTVPTVLYFSLDSGDVGHIVSLDLADRWTHPLTKGAFFDDDPVMSPDGRVLAFDRRVGDGQSRIMILDLASGAIRPASSPPAGSIGGDQYPDWSPDGRQIVYEEDGSLRVADVADGTSVELVPASAEAHRPRWSPDGRWIVYGNPDDGSGAHSVHVVAVPGPGQRDLTVPSVYAAAPAWSPDGTFLAYVVRNPSEGDLGLWVMTADGGSPTATWHSTPGVDMFPGHPSWGTAP